MGNFTAITWEESPLSSTIDKLDDNLRALYRAVPIYVLAGLVFSAIIFMVSPSEYRVNTLKRCITIVFGVYATLYLFLAIVRKGCMKLRPRFVRDISVDQSGIYYDQQMEVRFNSTITIAISRSKKGALQMAVENNGESWLLRIPTSVAIDELIAIMSKTVKVSCSGV